MNKIDSKNYKREVNEYEIISMIEQDNLLRCHLDAAKAAAYLILDGVSNGCETDVNIKELEKILLIDI